MPDEFPTLEVALAASVVVLLWRGYQLRRSRVEFDSGQVRLLGAFEHGAPSARELAAAHLGDWLEPLARAVLTAHSQDVGRAVAERATRMRRRVRSAAARDLVVCAVLGGSLVYAWAAGLGVSRSFYALGILASLLLLAAVAERVRLDRSIARTAVALSATRAADRPARSTRDRYCPACGHIFELRLTALEDVGPRLADLGVREVLVCGHCGHIEGKANPRPDAGPPVTTLP